MSQIIDHCLLNADSGEPVSLSEVPGKVVMFSTPSPGKPFNEDCAMTAVMPGGHLVLAVSDGVGGAARGGEASRLAVTGLLSSLRASSDAAGSQRAAILDGFERANGAIMDLAVGAACTLVVVEVFDHCFRTYHAGDSGCIVTGQRGKLKYRTMDHSPVSYALESGLLSEAEALVHEQRHIVSNVLGSAGMSVQLSAPMELSIRDTLLLASDGVFDNASIDEIKEAVRTGSLSGAAASLSDLIQGRMGGNDPFLGKPDDLSFILLRP